MSNKPFVDALCAVLFPKSEPSKPPTTSTTKPKVDPAPLQLKSEVHDKDRGDAYLPTKGDSGRAVHPVFSCHGHSDIS